jgi:methyltransferase (TIGR00027 family)
MKEKHASFTAQMMALYRAMESHRPAGQRLFTDDDAGLFLSGRLKLASWMARFPAGERWLYRYMQRRIPGALASGVARTRYIDDLLEARLHQCVSQVILLGAGFDTRALRLPCLREVRVVEVDHPDTAGRKQAILRKGLPQLPAHVSYLSIDFNRQSLSELFRERGVDLSLPTVILWEGVTNYLQREAIDEVMRLAARFPAGSAIIFTYIHRRVLEEPAAFFGAERLIADLARIEEKWTCGFVPEEMPDYLRAFGLGLVEDRGAAEYRQQYMPERTVLLKGYEFYRVAVAEVRH